MSSTAILQTMLGGLLAIFLSAVILLISRPLVCWYLKVNEVLRLLRTIEERLALLGSTLSATPKAPPTKPASRFVVEEVHADGPVE